MASKTIMLVDLAVEPARRQEFDDFYHDFYIPEFLRAVPDVTTARRFVQTNAGQRENELVHYLTIYEVSSDHAPEAIDAAIARCAHRDASDQFKRWKQSGLTHFERAYFAEAFMSNYECPTDALWKFEDVLALFWSVPQQQSDDISNQAAEKIASELTRVASIRGARTYEKPEKNRCSNFLSVLALPNSTSAEPTLTAAQNIFLQHAHNNQMAPALRQSMILHVIFSLVPSNNQA